VASHEPSFGLLGCVCDSLACGLYIPSGAFDCVAPCNCETAEQDRESNYI